MKRLVNSLTAIFVAVATLLTIPLPALAASNSIGITPRHDFTIRPGEKVQEKIVVKNLDPKVELNATIQILDFKASGQSGEPSLLLNQQTPTKWSLKPYLTIQDIATIPAGQSKEIPFTVAIPQNVGGGSFYSAIRFFSGGSGSNGNVGLSSSAVSLVFVNVPGKTNDSLTLQNFGAFVPSADLRNGTYKTFFGAEKPKYISYTLKNNGNVAEAPIGSIRISNIFGKEYKLIQNLNPNHNLVLIDQTRRIDVCIKEPAGTKQDNTEDSVENISSCETPSLLPGKYTAKIDLLYGNHNSSTTEIRATSTFWYLPAWFIIAVIVTLLVIIGIIWLIVHAIRNARGRKFRGR